ncbi:MAG: hypothetical protein KDI71_03690 [Xanthomonadales bacterium]|nr:hypothetical protein [Xanthomonadales bacterium]
MTRYASSTNVSSSASRSEIERTLERYGASAFAYATERRRAMVQFDMNNRRVRFVLPLPDPHAREFTHTPTRGTRRGEAQRLEAWEQACRQAWRALALVVKAKLEAIESGITTFDDEFMAHLVLPSGGTVGEFMRPQIERSYSDGSMPALLPAPTTGA